MYENKFYGKKINKEGKNEKIINCTWSDFGIYSNKSNNNNGVLKGRGKINGERKE